MKSRKSPLESFDETIRRIKFSGGHYEHVTMNANEVHFDDLWNVQEQCYAECIGWC